MSPRITYGLSAQATLTFPEVDRLVRDMHEHACRLSFPAVSPVFRATGKQCAYANWRNLPAELLWMVVQNAKLVAQPFCPADLAGFTVLPAEGAEWAAFGFCRFERGKRGKSLPPVCEQVLDHRWSWSAWCSTQHAANLKCGGTENFLRGHVSVLQVLEFCQQRGWLSDIQDPYGYWSHRDERKLLENVRSSLAQLAALAGAFKDALADSHEVSSPILGHPEFEHLEAEGRRFFSDP